MTESSINVEQLAQATDDLREAVRALVAGLVTDGFTDREARAIVAGSLAVNIPKEDS